MSGDRLPLDPFGRSRLPLDLEQAAQHDAETEQRRAEDAADMEQRVRWFAQVTMALLDGKVPPDDARLFIGGGMLAFLDGAGELQRILGLVGRRSSKITAARVWTRMQRQPARKD